MLGARKPLTVLAAAATVLMTFAGQAGAASSKAEKTLTKALDSGINAAGSSSGAYVVDLNTGTPLYAYKPGIGRLPASVEKLYTTSTALLRLGPDATLTTRLLGSGSLSSDGTWHGTLYLRGGGDPTFGSVRFGQANYGGLGATVQRLVANLVRTTGIKAIQGAIVADGSYFDSLRGTPATGYSASILVEGLLDGLSFNRGWADPGGANFQPRPTLYAGQRLVAALRAGGVRVPAKTRVTAGKTPATAQLLALVRSPDLATLLKLTNAPSDNYFAETLLKDLGAQFGGTGSTAAGAGVVRAEVAEQFGIHPHLNDGSGLSYYDSTSPRQVVALLQHMESNTEFINSLAIAGQTGTLTPVDRGTIAQGRCRGKTGTLAAVANVVGYCQAKDGHTLAFAFLVSGNSSTDYVHNVVEGKMMNALVRYNG
jgi:D-alanyl-D-alanine carboxypeptidase/D-alanyl-D-alanine-endopeptidase (penicillin-binding protein 4)